MTLENLTPYIASGIGTVVTSMIAIAVLRTRADSGDARAVALEVRVGNLEQRQDTFIDRMARIEVKIDLLLSQSKIRRPLTPSEE